MRERLVSAPTFGEMADTASTTSSLGRPTIPNRILANVLRHKDSYFQTFSLSEISSQSTLRPPASRPMCLA